MPRCAYSSGPIVSGRNVIRRSLAVVSALLLSGGVAAQKYPSHFGTSPISFDAIAPPNGEYAVSDRRSGVLDSYKFRGNGTYDITVSVPISRYVGDVSEAVTKGVLSDKAKIYIPAYDIDSGTYPVGDCDGDGVDESFQPEVDEVYFNDELIGTLDGTNNVWKFNDTFEVPIHKVNFPSSPGGVAENTISIKIDVANADVPLSGGGIGCQVWATEIDWVGIKFDAAQPIYLMAGLFGSPDALNDSGYIENIKDQVGVHSEVMDHALGSLGFCSSTELRAISSHADEFLNKITENAAAQGTANVHLVGHSMGGLDGRMLLKKLSEKEYLAQVATMDGQPVYEEIKIDSLLTHGSPHKGTVVADYLPSISGLSGLVEDLCELKVSIWKTANQALTQLNGASFAAIGSDADLDQSGDLNAIELAGNQIPWSGLANKLYKMLYNHDEVQLTYEEVETPAGTVYVTIPTYLGAGPNPNDTMVTSESATGAPGISQKLVLNGSSGKNHGTVIDTDTQNQAITIGKNSLGWGDL